MRALNTGARKGGFAHDTGEGGVSPYHRENGGDIIWEIGSGYFGCRNRDGSFNPEEFARVAADDQIKMVELKISQGAKPGHGGVLPAAKVSEEISKIRGVADGRGLHFAGHPPRVFDAAADDGVHRRDAQAVGRQAAGFKLCIGHPWEFLAICKAMLETGIYPDFIVVDGNEGGTGAAPLEFMDHLGMPMREGVNFVHNALIGINARDRIKIGAAGKIATAFDMARAMAIGADWCNSARGFMFALGCIQSLSCHTDRCPTGVTTQDPLRARALVVPLKTERVYMLPSRHPARAVRTSRRRRPRTSAAVAADPLLEANLEHRGDVVRETLSVAASGRVDRRHPGSALPRCLGDGARGFVPAGGIKILAVSPRSLESCRDGSLVRFPWRSFPGAMEPARKR